MKYDFESLDFWHIFISVAMHGSMNRAAAELGIDVASVSRKIAKLETSLGFKLFDRSQSVPILTNEGRDCLHQVLPHMTHLVKTVQNIGTSSESMVGQVRVCCHVGLIMPMSQWLADFQTQHPDIEVNIITAVRYSDLSRFDYDIAFWPGKGISLNESHKALDMAKTPTYICATPQYLEQHGPVNTVADLKNHRIITNSALAYPPVLYGPDGAVSFPVNNFPAYKIDSMIGLKLAVMQHTGIALGLPCFMVVREFNNGSLVRLLEPLQSYAFHLRLFMKPTAPHRVSVLCNWIKTCCAKEFGHCPAYGPDIITIEERFSAPSFFS